MSSMLVQHCLNDIQMFSVYWGGQVLTPTPTLDDMNDLLYRDFQHFHLDVSPVYVQHLN